MSSPCLVSPSTSCRRSLFFPIQRLIKEKHTKPAKACVSQRKLSLTLGDKSEIHSLRKLSLFIQFVSQIHFYTNINTCRDSPAQIAGSSEPVSPSPLSPSRASSYLPSHTWKSPIHLRRPCSHTILSVKLFKNFHQEAVTPYHGALSLL